MTGKQKSEFKGLACALSPENLHCDGELSWGEAMRKQRQLLKKWAALERKIGRFVSEDDAWSL